MIDETNSRVKQNEIGGGMEYIAIWNYQAIKYEMGKQPGIKSAPFKSSARPLATKGTVHLARHQLESSNFSVACEVNGACEDNVIPVY